MRFVLLKHTTPAESTRPTHLDLMLQSRTQNSLDDRCLITFEIPLEQTDWGGMTIRRLAPHRAMYLDFTGEIGDARGFVERVDAGALRWILQSDRRLEFELQFSSLTYREKSGIWRLNRTKNSDWWSTEQLSATSV